MHPWKVVFVGVLCGLGLGCTTSARRPAAAGPAADATLAQIFFWRARPGMAAEYDRYIREVAEPIDHEAQRAGAFLAVATYAASDTTVPWTHMRVFLVRDSVQLQGLAAALSAAGARLEPDSIRRRRKGEYSATLRDRAGSVVTRIVK